jgi:hypothetical protein
MKKLLIMYKYMEQYQNKYEQSSLNMHKVPADFL